MPEFDEALDWRVMVGRVAPETLVVMDAGVPALTDGLAVEEPVVVAEVLGLSALVKTAEGRVAVFCAACIFPLGLPAVCRDGVPGKLAVELLLFKIAMVLSFTLQQRGQTGNVCHWGQSRNIFLFRWRNLGLRCSGLRCN